MHYFLPHVVTTLASVIPARMEGPARITNATTARLVVPKASHAASLAEQRAFTARIHYVG
jgi:hypothetical protein